MLREWTSDELITSWTLVEANWQLVSNKTGATRLGFAFLLKFFAREARFPRGSEELPPVVVAYVAEQVKVDPELFDAYDWDGRSIKYHREQIRGVFGFREFTRGDEDKIAAWLAEEVCPVELHEEQLRQAVLVRCRSERLEPPGRIERILGSARAGFEQRFCEKTLSRLDDACLVALEDLIAEDAPLLPSGRGLLAELKADPGQVSLETLLREIDKLNAVRALGLPGGDNLNVPAVMAVLAAPPQIHPAGGAWGGDPVGVDQRAVHDHMRVTSRLWPPAAPV